METILCKKCGTKYHTAVENLNQGKYLKCKVCSKKVYLRISKELITSGVLKRLRQNALSLLPLSLQRLVDPRNASYSRIRRR